MASRDDDDSDEEMLFLDLLDKVELDGYEEDPYMTLANRVTDVPTGDWEHGPLNWNVKCSAELQEVVSALDVPELNGLKFSVTVADPRQADFPLIACSTGFADLTGYMLKEIVGRNCRFLLNGVPQSYISEQTRYHARDFCVAVSQGFEYDSTCEILPQGVKSRGLPLPKGEIMCVQTNAMKHGELFRNMFYMKQVWLDDAPFILGLQAGIPEEYESGTNLEGLDKKCALAVSRLGQHMCTLETVLASLFWYSAAMRRQD